MATYAELLLDPRWQRKRLEALNAYNWRCDRCGSPESTLHVHHKMYRKGAKPWEYDVSELVVLCDPCHKTIHDLKSELDSLIANSEIQYTLLRMLVCAAKTMVILNTCSDGAITVSSPEEAGLISYLSSATSDRSRDITSRVMSGETLSVSPMEIETEAIIAWSDEREKQSENKPEDVPCTSK